MLNNLDQYKNYLGLGNKPEDFDQIWDHGKKLVDQLGTNYELEKVNIPSNIVNFYDLYFTGIDQGRVHAQLIMPKELKGSHPGLIQFHGYHGNAGDYQDKVGLAAEGFVVLALDCRGQGGLSIDNTAVKGDIMKGLIIRGIEEWDPTKLYYYRVFLDTYQLAHILMNMDHVDPNRIFLKGVSQGGGLSLACAGLTPEIHKVLVTYPFLSDYRKAYQYGPNTAFGEISYWFQYRDPLHQKEEQFFDLLDYIDVKYFAEKIKAPVIWSVGGSDHTVPPETQMAAYNRIKTEKKLLIEPEYGHEKLRGIDDATRAFLIE